MKIESDLALKVVVDRERFKSVCRGSGGEISR